MRRVHYRRLNREHLQCGDMWASTNPNSPERQGDPDYNLQMQAVHPNNYGKPACDVPLGNGGFWRPINIVTA